MGQGIGVKPLTRVGLPKVSRFRQTLLYPDVGMSFGLWSFKDTSIPSDVSDRTHTVKLGEEFRWDLISYREYQNPYLWWALCIANGVQDPFMTPSVNDQLRVPTIERLNRLLLTDRPAVGSRVLATRLVSV